jgi:hypothetical protein
VAGKHRQDKMGFMSLTVLVTKEKRRLRNRDHTPCDRLEKDIHRVDPGERSPEMPTIQWINSKLIFILTLRGYTSRALCPSPWIPQ